MYYLSNYRGSTSIVFSAERRRAYFLSEQAGFIKFTPLHPRPALDARGIRGNLIKKRVRNQREPPGKKPIGG